MAPMGTGGGKLTNWPSWGVVLCPGASAQTRTKMVLVQTEGPNPRCFDLVIFFRVGTGHFEANLHLRQKESSPRGRNLRFGLLTILLSLRGFLCEVIDLMVFFRLTCCLLAHPFGTLCLKS